jgi:hypothetical protein
MEAAMKLAVEKFIESHESWAELLSKPPFSLRVRENPDIPDEWLFSYSMIDSDFYDEVVRDCRGLILHIDPKTRETRRVCYAFRKFANYGEGYADKIDWNTASVYSKIDGSLIRAFVRPGDDYWSWATNNGFSADAELPGVGSIPLDESPMYATFMDAIDAASESSLMIDADYTLMFELTSRQNRIVVDYGPKPKLWLLGARCLSTGVEITPEEAKEKFKLSYDIPEKYSITSLDEVVAAAEKLGRDKEGFVVVDAQFHRVKVKGPAYLAVHHLKDANGQLSWKHVFKCLQNGVIDDVVGTFPEYASAITTLIEQYATLTTHVKQAVRMMKDTYSSLLSQVKTEMSGQADDLHRREARKRYAMMIHGAERLKPFSVVLFDLLRGGDSDELVKQYLMKLDYDEFVQIARSAL